MSYQVIERHEGNKCILVKERNQSENVTYCMITTI